MTDELFEDVDRRPSATESDAPARYETANRTQVELTPIDLEASLPPEHAARMVWGFVEGLDLSALYARIKAREGHAGRTPIDPKILVALWLYATIDGVGSAREVDRLCYAHDAYRWLRGGVSVNHHTLSDFRVAHAAVINDLLTQSIATLHHQGIVTLARVAQDGTRIRASAGVGSFRREATLAKCLRDARQLVRRTAQQGAGERSREQAAQARAAAERLARVEAALAELPAVAEAKARNKSTSVPRASTTDAQARIMKMADAGFRPAYNVQFATDEASDVIVGVAVTNAGSDQQQFVPMLDQIETRVGRPACVLADGGYRSHEAIETAAARGVTALIPSQCQRGTDQPVAVQPTDSPAVAAWRTHMATEAAKADYRRRGAIAERLNADLRTHRGLGRVLVRGLTKVHTVVLWVALAHNVMRAMAIVPHQMT